MGVPQKRDFSLYFSEMHSQQKSIPLLHLPVSLHLRPLTPVLDPSMQVDPTDQSSVSFMERKATFPFDNERYCIPLSLLPQ